MEIKYEIKKGARIKGEVKLLVKELKEIDNINNCQLIINYARKHPKSELYKNFEWNDSIAAEKWRKQQAREIMKVILVIEINKTPVHFRAFESIEIEENGLKTNQYVDTIEAVQDNQKRQLIINEINKLLIQAQVKINNFSELITIILGEKIYKEMKNVSKNK